ncbi:MAG: hypothetical protein WAM30_06960 [Candidatus Dormiibacterota bacterium]
MALTATGRIDHDERGLDDYLDGRPIPDWTDRLADLQPSYA